MIDPGSAGLQPGSEGTDEKAKLELGVPGISKAPKGWHSRGYLPHRDDLRLLQSITFRLADSLPQPRLLQIEEILAALPPDQREVARRRQIEGWLDSGIGCCALRHPALAAVVEDALLHFDGARYRLLPGASCQITSTS
jgi:hypothetical protein